MVRRLALLVFGFLALASCGQQGTCTVRFEGIVIRVEENIGEGDCFALCVENQTCDWVPGGISSLASIVEP